MSLFDEIKSQFGGPSGSAENPESNLLQGVLSLLNNPSTGGLAGLVSTFQQKGLGDVVSSWVGTGQNLPISAEQIRHALGGEQISQLASETGLSEEGTTSKLTEVLPGLVDKLTPDGKIPEGSMLEQGMNLLKGKLF